MRNQLCIGFLWHDMANWIIPARVRIGAETRTRCVKNAPLIVANKTRITWIFSADKVAQESTFACLTRILQTPPPDFRTFFIFTKASRNPLGITVIYYLPVNWSAIRNCCKLRIIRISGSTHLKSLCSLYVIRYCEVSQRLVAVGSTCAGRRRLLMNYDKH